jgi:hypothetical protein
MTIEPCTHNFQHLRESASRGTETFFCTKCLHMRVVPSPEKTVAFGQAAMEDVNGLVVSFVEMIEAKFAPIPDEKRPVLENETYDKLSAVVEEFLGYPDYRSHL